MSAGMPLAALLRCAWEQQQLGSGGVHGCARVATDVRGSAWAPHMRPACCVSVVSKTGQGGEGAQ